MRIVSLIPSAVEILFAVGSRELWFVSTSAMPEQVRACRRIQQRIVS